MYTPKTNSRQYKLIKKAQDNEGWLMRKDVRELLELEGAKNIRKVVEGIVNKLKKYGVIVKLGSGYRLTEPYSNVKGIYYVIVNENNIIFQSDDIMDALKKAEKLRKTYNDLFEIYEVEKEKYILMARYTKTRNEPKTYFIKE